LPGVSIAPDGRLDIAWNDARNSPRPAASPGRDRGLLDIYHTSSTDQGATFAPSLRMNDRSIDRSLGVWSNNVNAAVAVGTLRATTRFTSLGRTPGPATTKHS
jgi:hypothetical protein